MDKLKRFIDIYIPTETCNLRCHYCYITQKRKFNNQLIHLTKTPEIIRKALSVERLGGVCLLNLCAGGETLLAGDLIPVIRTFLEEGHYVMVVTNGTLSKRFDEIAQFEPRLLKRLFFKFSFHYLELIRLNMLDIFFNNIKRMYQCGCSFTLEITPNDELIPYIDEIKEICVKEVGALCHVTIARDDRNKEINHLSAYSFEEYKKIWGTFDSALFDFKTQIFYQKRREFCYAGEWSAYLNLSSGEMKQCYGGKILEDNIYENLTHPLHFEAIGHKCNIARKAHCYNGHAFLTLGNIPELDTPTYDTVRNRKDNYDGYWLRPEMQAFMSQKLKDNNNTYSTTKKMLIDIKKDFSKLKRIQKRLKKN